MFLYLVRHGDAKKEAEDLSRGLSDKGRYDMSRVAAYLSQLNLRVLRIFHSPKTRARQTAEMLSEYLKPVKGLSEADGLAPLDPPDIWASRIRGTHDDTILVGHLPHLGSLASLLLCGDALTQVIAFRTAGIVCLNRDHEGNWSLEWMLTPEIVLGEKGIGYTCDSL